MIFKICIVFCILTQTVAAQNVRKYNLEQEAFKLFKQDFKSVLKRFRRTPDYLRILEQKLADLRLSTIQMSSQVLNYFYRKMEQHVIHVLPPQQDTIKLDDEKDRNYFRTEDRADARPPHISPEDWKKINALDSYNFFYSHLTVPERNTLKEMGFSYAGQVIHSIVSNMKPVTNSEEEKEKVTKPYEAETVTKTTTAHPETPKFKYVFDDDESTKHVERTAPVEDRRFRASTSPVSDNLTAVRKHAEMAQLISTPTALSTRKVAISILNDNKTTFKD